MLESGLRSIDGANVLALWGKRILVVEDDPIIAVEYRFQLEGVGAIITLT
jgi:hypothetical protein